MALALPTADELETLGGLLAPLKQTVLRAVRETGLTPRQLSDLTNGQVTAQQVWAFRRDATLGDFRTIILARALADHGLLDEGVLDLG